MISIKTLGIISLLAIPLCIVGCDNGPATSKGELKIFMTDDPVGYNAVNVVIKEVAVHSDDQGWIVLNDSTRTFNLLSLTNGASVLLGGAKLNAGHYTQIRLLVDSGSNVVVNGVAYSLNIPSGLQTGIKLNHEFTLQADFTYELMLDFDVNRSIILTGNGVYQMKPVIRVEAVAQSGAIAGFVAPVIARATLTAFSSADTASTYADTSSGQFKIVALPPALYALHVAPSDSAVFKDTTLTHVQVNAGQTTNVRVISLSHK